MDFDNKLKPMYNRSNSPEVANKIRQRIINAYKPKFESDGITPNTRYNQYRFGVDVLPEDFNPVEKLKQDFERYKGGENMVKNYVFGMYGNQDIISFINDLNLQELKGFTNLLNKDAWDYYTKLLGKEVNNIIKKPKLQQELLEYYRKK
jgi:hypothetical protein